MRPDAVPDHDLKGGEQAGLAVLGGQGEVLPKDTPTQPSAYHI